MKSLIVMNTHDYTVSYMTYYYENDADLITDLMNLVDAHQNSNCHLYCIDCDWIDCSLDVVKAMCMINKPIY